jgi:hypothetical protein
MSEFDFSGINFPQLLKNNSEGDAKRDKFGVKLTIYDDYKILKYDKKNLSTDETTKLRLFRSVIFYKSKMVSFAPPKSHTADEKWFCNNRYNDIVFQEFAEGPMINLFYIPQLTKWQIATRSFIKGMTKTYNYVNKSHKSFHHMFDEACRYDNIDYKLLNKKYVYSFVLRHPQNETVCNYSKPHLILTNIYYIKTCSDDKQPKNLYTYKIKDKTSSCRKRWLPPSQIVKSYGNLSYNEAEEEYASMNTPYYIKGVVFYNPLTGERSKLRNPNYEMVKTIDDKNLKSFFEFLSLRYHKQINNYHSYYINTNKDLFKKYEKIVKGFTRQLFENYMNCFVRKKTKIEYYSKNFISHIQHLHRLYIGQDVLQVNMKVVIEYINSLNPMRLMYSLNHELRQKNVDNIKLQYNKICRDK